MEKKILLYEIFLEKNSSIKGRNCGVKKKKKKEKKKLKILHLFYEYFNFSNLIIIII